MRVRPVAALTWRTTAATPAAAVWRGRFSPGKSAMLTTHEGRLIASD
jgi:hypothetical protein